MTDLTPVFAGILQKHGKQLRPRTFSVDNLDDFLKEAYKINEHIVSLHREKVDADAKQMLRKLNASIKGLRETEQVRHETEIALISQKYGGGRGFSLAKNWVAGGVAGLAGASLYPTPTTALANYLNENSIADFASAAYAKSNIALVAEGASSANVSKWTEQFFKSVPSGSAVAKSKATTYYGGEQRTAHLGGNSFVIAFPGSGFGTPKPEVAVISALLGGQPSVKWSAGFSLLSKAAAKSPGASAIATNYAYSDAGLLAVQINGAASAVRSAALEAAKAIKSIAEGTVSKEDLTKAIAKAKFDALEASESGRNTLLAAGSGIVHTGSPVQIAAAVKAIGGVTAEKIKSAAKALIDGKATVTAVGDLHVLPYAEELGLKV